MIRFAEISDLDTLASMDKHVSPADELKRVIANRRIIVSESNIQLAGWLRFGLFWDEIPFMNMLFVIESERGKGVGTALAEYWENEMRLAGYSFVLTSTLSSEQAQFFYRNRGYKDCGSLLLPNEPLEIILSKELIPQERQANLKT